MPDRDWKLRVEDILDSIAKVQRYTDGMTLDQFIADEMVIDAGLRNFTVIGEASRHVAAEAQARYPQAPWDEMQAMVTLSRMNTLALA